MNSSEVIALPSFFYTCYNDESKTDKGFETFIDFYLSWTFHCANQKYKYISPKVYEYSRRVVFLLIFGLNNDDDEYFINVNINDSFQITSINTRRQWNYIDLLAEIVVNENSESKTYILNIENKWYSQLRTGQLETYKKIVQDEYSDVNYNIINLYITYKDIYKSCKEEKNFCRQNNYKFLNIWDIHCLSKMEVDGKTDNALFDEFWFNL